MIEVLLGDSSPSSARSKMADFGDAPPVVNHLYYHRQHQQGQAATVATTSTSAASYDEDGVAGSPSAGPPAVAAHLFGESFQFIVHEQAKSMVAIQVRPFPLIASSSVPTSQPLFTITLLPHSL